ncbi:MAG: hypothetical protein ACKVXR_11200 [Planctomycetota bacterium]
MGSTILTRMGQVSRGRLVGARTATLLLLVGALGGCASLREERHLAPLYTHISRGGGGTEFEGLGGIVRVRRPRPGGPHEQFAIRPLVIVDRTPEGETLSHFLTPLGSSKESGGEYWWQLIPLARYDRDFTDRGELEWTFLSLPGIYWARRADGRILRAVFPFGGVVEDAFSFDRLVFVLFPLYARAERHGRVTYSFLFPVFAVTRGESGSGWRIWPIYGTSKVHGSYERSFFLWPIVHWQRNNLWAPKEKQEVKWMVFPFFGRVTRDTYSSHSILWPFFGWARNAKTDFWSYDGPWPLVRLHHDPQGDTFRTRFWPFYSRYRGDGLDSTWILWPIVNWSTEVYPETEKNSVFILPFWQSWKRHDTGTGRSSFHKLWPLYQIERAEDRYSKFAFPALNPLWRTPDIDEMYAWIYELYTRERVGDIVHTRSWLGIYRREKDALEDRASITGLWGRRRYGQGKNIAETSLLFGLIRWRKTASGSLEWLPPAIPGPGWPLAREEPGG